MSEEMNIRIVEDREQEEQEEQKEQEEQEDQEKQEEQEPMNPKEAKKLIRKLEKAIRLHEKKIEKLKDAVKMTNIAAGLHDRRYQETWPLGTVMYRHGCGVCNEHYNLSCGCCSICDLCPRCKLCKDCHYDVDHTTCTVVSVEELL